MSVTTDPRTPVVGKSEDVKSAALARITSAEGWFRYSLDTYLSLPDDASSWDLKNGEIDVNCRRAEYVDAVDSLMKSNEWKEPLLPEETILNIRSHTDELFLYFEFSKFGFYRKGVDESVTLFVPEGMTPTQKGIVQALQLNGLPATKTRLPPITE